MKRIFVLFLFLSFELLFPQKNGIPFTVSNPISLNRSSETVSLDLKGLIQHHPATFGKTLSVYENGKELTTQSIDNDFDGCDDELIFQSSFKPHETKKFVLQFSNAIKSPVQSVVDGRYVLPREDFAWENDRIAFRVYGSVLAGNVDNGIDVWTKRVRYPIVKKWYDGEEQTPKIVYHEDHGEGADFFSVGRSLGAGSAGIMWKGKLIQPGLFSQYRIVTNGPLRISFEIFYSSLKLDTVRYLEKKRITLDAGMQLNMIEEQFISNAAAESLVIAAGLVKRKNTNLLRSPDNKRMSLWGSTNDDSTNGYLGTAVVFPFANGVSAYEDSVQFYLTNTFDRNHGFKYFSGASWTRMGDIGGEQEWIRYLDEFIIRVNNSLVVSFQQPKK